MNQIVENFQSIEKQIQKSCQEWKRERSAVNLVAVSKKQPVDKIEVALHYGHRLFGENRVQEAQERWAGFKPNYPDLKLHLIGPLQTNKAKEAVALFDVIETVDRPKLVDALAKELKKQNKNLPCFIQVNVGEEEQKAGVLPQDFEALYDYAMQAGLTITGLMCIPPADKAAAPYFALMQKMAEAYDLPNLSMGMSGDFEKAIPLGATHIRVGTALFGQRQLL